MNLISFNYLVKSLSVNTYYVTIITPVIRTGLSPITAVTYPFVIFYCQ
jgi:hypothetical protein